MVGCCSSSSATCCQTSDSFSFSDSDGSLTLEYTQHEPTLHQRSAAKCQPFCCSLSHSKEPLTVSPRLVLLPSALCGAIDADTIKQRATNTGNVPSMIKLTDRAHTLVDQQPRRCRPTTTAQTRSTPNPTSPNARHPNSPLRSLLPPPTVSHHCPTHPLNEPHRLALHSLLPPPRRTSTRRPTQRPPTRTTQTLTRPTPPPLSPQPPLLSTRHDSPPLLSCTIGRPLPLMRPHHCCRR